MNVPVVHHAVVIAPDHLPIQERPDPKVLHASTING